MVRYKELLPPSASDCAWFKINGTSWHPSPRVSVAVTSLVRHPVTKLREAIRAPPILLTDPCGGGFILKKAQTPDYLEGLRQKL